jgi:TPP-dependent pyruvate/acetoin dehydrogenase alpha subunit
VYGAASHAVARARAGEGPTFLVLNTYRYHGHHVGDVDRAYYRSKEEEERWRTERDPIDLLGAWLGSQAGVDRDALEQVEREARDEIAAGADAALAAPFPDPSEVDQHVYA